MSTESRASGSILCYLPKGGPGVWPLQGDPGTQVTSKRALIGQRGMVESPCGLLSPLPSRPGEDECGPCVSPHLVLLGFPKAWVGRVLRALLSGSQGASHQLRERATHEYLWVMGLKEEVPGGPARARLAVFPGLF